MVGLGASERLAMSDHNMTVVIALGIICNHGTYAGSDSGPNQRATNTASECCAQRRSSTSPNQGTCPGTNSAMSPIVDYNYPTVIVAVIVGPAMAAVD